MYLLRLRLLLWFTQCACCPRPGRRLGQHFRMPYPGQRDGQRSVALRALALTSPARRTIQ
eukprot:1913186-Rhodomonas_salina.6